MDKRNLTKIVRNHSAFKLGIVKTKNQDGSFDVVEKGRTNAFKNLQVAGEGNFEEGMVVIIYCPEGDIQKAYVGGYAAYIQADSQNTFERI
jgi:hypothetical protein